MPDRSLRARLARLQADLAVYDDDDDFIAPPLKCPEGLTGVPPGSPEFCRIWARHFRDTGQPVPTHLQPYLTDPENEANA